MGKDPYSEWPWKPKGERIGGLYKKHLNPQTNPKHQLRVTYIFCARAKYMLIHGLLPFSSRAYDRLEFGFIGCAGMELHGKKGPLLPEAPVTFSAVERLQMGPSWSTQRDLTLCTSITYFHCWTRCQNCCPLGILPSFREKKGTKKEDKQHLLGRDARGWLFRFGYIHAKRLAGLESPTAIGHSLRGARVSSTSALAPACSLFFGGVCL